MRPVGFDVAWSVVCRSVCWCHGCTTKTAEPIKMPFGWWTVVLP